MPVQPTPYYGAPEAQPHAAQAAASGALSALAAQGDAVRSAFEGPAAIAGGIADRLLAREDRRQASEFDYGANTRLLEQEGAQKAALARLQAQLELGQDQAVRQRQMQMGNDFLRLLTDKKAGLIEEVEFTPDLAIPGISEWDDASWERRYPGRGAEMRTLAKPRKMRVVNSEVLHSWLAQHNYSKEAMQIVEDRIGDMADSMLEAEERYKKDVRAGLGLMGGQSSTQMSLSPTDLSRLGGGAAGAPQPVMAPDEKALGDVLGDPKQLAAKMGTSEAMLGQMLSSNPGAIVSTPQGAQWVPVDPRTREPAPELYGELHPNVRTFFERLNLVLSGSPGIATGALGKGLDPASAMTPGEIKKLGPLANPDQMAPEPAQEAPSYDALFQYLRQP